MSEVTRILAGSDDDGLLLDRLLPVVYAELRRLASTLLEKERGQKTLQPTALVHEAYLRLIGEEPLNFETRAHFFGAAAQSMRRILVDLARKRARLKNGGGREQYTLHEEDAIVPSCSDDFLLFNEALEDLGEEDEMKAKLVQLRYFSGLSVEEAGKALGLSRATAHRHWVYSRAWLYDRMHSSS